MRIVVTGASGNVGTALLRRLAADPRHELLGIARREPPPIAPYSSARWRCIDISADDATANLVTAFAGADVVVHLAWLIQPSHDRELLRRTNQGGTAAVVAAVRAVGVPHFVHQSSIGAYAPGTGRVVDESWSTAGVPTSTYSVDKAAAERLVDVAEPDTVVTRTRPGLVFQDDAAGEVGRYFVGPLVPRSLLRAAVLRFAPLPPAMAFQLVHADDLAEALALLIERRAGGAFNIAAAPVIDRAVFRETFGGVGPPVPPTLIRALADATWRARLQPTEPGWIDLAAQAPVMDTGRIEALGWRATRDAAEVLRTFVAALRTSQGHGGPLLRPGR